ncbi:MAG: 2-C-methyl-D-erythritol 2,4-cyclodiphosphate synthase [Clostridia bacterium]|nr:2-C-methyl-D-erythritol 2,4-cyclodiphosphate synthase [Clostridia bacterium]
MVVAAGRGVRAGLPYNKVFYKLCGRSVLSRSLDALSRTGLIDEIVLVISRDDMALYQKTASEEGACPLVKSVVFGGETRRDSVYSGLKAISPDADIVLVHDAARPFVTREIVSNVISDACKYGSGIISSPVTDTLKRVSGDMTARETIDRSEVRSVQTPQAFDYKKLMQAHETLPPDDSATDDAYLYEKCFGGVRLTEAQSARENIKLTTPEDFKMAEARLASEIRVGTGYDVHRLVEGRRLVLCGVEIPYEKGLLGHSDADVATHALMDAMLGAAALGDIGKLFPDNDERFKDISSLILLERANDALHDAGYELINCDITIVCQKPRLAPHIDEMRARLGEKLRLDERFISVKATTTEGLGFEGEGKGISAQSVAAVRRTAV